MEMRQKKDDHRLQALLACMQDMHDALRWSMDLATLHLAMACVLAWHDQFESHLQFQSGCRLAKPCYKQAAPSHFPRGLVRQLPLRLVGEPDRGAPGSTADLPFQGRATTWQAEGPSAMSVHGVTTACLRDVHGTIPPCARISMLTGCSS